MKEKEKLREEMCVLLGFWRGVFRSSERGAYMIEYILLIAFIAVMAIPSIKGAIAPMVMRPACEVMEGFGEDDVSFGQFENRWICYAETGDGYIDLFTGTYF